LNGEYGLKDVFLGVPVRLGSQGIEEVIELKLDKNEKKLLEESAGSVKGMMDALDNMHIFEE
jgi:malate dehydrogenase